jgi:hypothetical protein
MPAEPPSAALVRACVLENACVQDPIRCHERGLVRVCLTVLMLACGCASHRAVDDRRIDPVSGQIGRLRVDRSTRDDVVAFAGRPEAEWRWHGTPDLQWTYPAYDALGFGCAASTAPTRLLPANAYPDDHLPNSKTLFFVNSKTGKLMSFTTTDARYFENHGVRVGMPTAVAKRLLHRRVIALGCNYADVSNYAAVSSGKQRALLLIQFTGGHARPPKYALVGGHVADFHVNTLGLFDCG